MKKTFISFLAAVYLLLMLSTTVERVCFENSKSTLIDLSNCEDITGDNEEPSSEDNRECEDDENIKADFSYGLQNLKANSVKRFSVYLNLNGFHFSEIDSPPPQA
jgi:hypothetical protein